MVTSSTTSATVSGAGFGYAANTMSLPPDNSLHQFLANGGYNFSRTTKLVGGFSYGRNTQNQSFVSDPLGLAPNSSLDGEVITTNANARLTDTSFKDLTLSGGFKYNERDNQTQSNLYRFFNITQIPTAAQFASGDTTSRVVNTPYSNRKTQIDLAGDYRLTNTQNLRFSYEYEDVKRWCNDVAAGAAGSGAGSNAGSGAPAGAQCVSGPSSSENRFNVLFRQRIGGVVNYYIGYTYADRNADYDPSFYTPYAINGGEYLGFRPFFEASRTQNVFKANVSWEATDQLNLSLNGRYGKDKYADSQFGDQDGKNWNINADATYRYAEEGSASIYAGYQYRDRNENLANNGSKSPLVAGTTTNQYVYGQKDESSSIGMNFKHTGLFGSKFDLAGDLAYYHDLTKQNTAWNYSVPPAATASCNLSNVNSCGDYPNVTNNLWQFKLLGSYNVDKTGKVNLYYVYQKLDSTDYYYNGYASGYTAAAQQPTNEQAPSYSVQAIGASYVVKF
jgi:MtrB/PioB family decaheme-associated outer membrane protein